MNRIALLIALLVLCLTLAAQETFTWATSGGGAQWDNVFDLACDSAGISYVVGIFYSSATFGATTINSAGDADILVAKLGPNGNWLWARRAGSSAADRASAIAVDADGNCYVTGYYRGSADFGPYTLAHNSYSDIFVAKLDASGNWLWAVNASSGEYETGNDICLDNSGNSYLAASFAYELTLGTHTVTGFGGSDILVAKISPAGNWLWATAAGGSSADTPEAIARDNAGNLYVGGWFWQDCAFGSHSLQAVNAQDAFVAKLSPTGNWLWATPASGNRDETIYSLAADADGNCCVTGNFFANATFGAENLITDLYSADIFVARIDSGGNWLWAVSAGGNSGDSGEGICLDAWGHIYVTGWFYQTALFGLTELTTQGLYTYEDAFVAKLDAYGNWLWAKRAGGGWGDRAYGISVPPDGSCRIAGDFNNSAGFDDIILPPLGGTAFVDVFVARLSLSQQPSSPLNLDIARNGTDNTLTWNSVTLDIHGQPIVPDGYRVYWSTVSPWRGYNLLAHVTGTSYVHIGGANNSRGWYYVKTLLE